MGRDATEGGGKIKAAGGKIIAQDEKSSLVFGMPRAAIESGIVDSICPLDEIAQRMIDLLDE